MMEEISIPLGATMQLAAKVWGPANGIPVIAVHGWLDNANSFDVIAPMLDGIRLVAIDVRGHGRSSHIDHCDSYILLDIVRDIFLVADHFKWERFNLLGHSMGAAACVLAAGTVPARVQRVAAIAALTPLEVPEAMMPFELEGSITQQAKLVQKPPKFYSAIKELVDNRTANPLFPISQAAAERLMQRGAVQTEQGFALSSDIKLRLPFAVRLTQNQVRSFLGRINCPVCFFMEEKGLFPAEFLQERIEQIKKIEVHQLAGSHHLHMEDAAPLMAGLLQSFFSHE